MHIVLLFIFVLLQNLSHYCLIGIVLYLWVIPCQINTGHNPTHSEFIFCEVVVPMEISIPAKFYCFIATTFLRADI
jgi:hypothetical protein